MKFIKEVELTISVDEAIDTLIDSKKNKFQLSDDQAMDLYKFLEDNPMTFIGLTEHVWVDKDIVGFLKSRFGNKGFTTKQDILDNICIYLETQNI